MSDKLTSKQERFVAEYLIDFNATQAAIRAGYSKKTATEQGSRLLTYVKIAAAIKAGQDRLAIQVERSAVEVLKDIQEIAKEARRDGDLKTALKGLEMEGKHLGMFTDRLEAKLDGDLVVRWEK